MFVRRNETPQLRDGDALTAAFVALHQAHAGGADESEETTRWEITQILVALKRLCCVWA